MKYNHIASFTGTLLPTFYRQKIPDITLLYNIVIFLIIPLHDS
jgi:hypothetical protein